MQSGELEPWEEGEGRQIWSTTILLFPPFFPLFLLPLSFLLLLESYALSPNYPPFLTD